jgi:hypothetical protein
MTDGANQKGRAVITRVYFRSTVFLAFADRPFIGRGIPRVSLKEQELTFMQFRATINKHHPLI